MVHTLPFSVNTRWVRWVISKLHSLCSYCKQYHMSGVKGHLLYGHNLPCVLLYWGEFSWWVWLGSSVLETDIDHQATISHPLPFLEREKISYGGRGAAGGWGGGAGWPNWRSFESINDCSALTSALVSAFCFLHVIWAVKGLTEHGAEMALCFDPLCGKVASLYSCDTHIRRCVWHFVLVLLS